MNIISQAARKISTKEVIFLAIPLVLSAYTHLWNPIGFPSIHIDEAHYMRRAMLVMKNLGPQDPYYQYDHPYFGQIFLAAILGMIGYPNSLLSSAEVDVHSIEMLYLVPRVVMGLLAVLDTFLLYKIAEYRYGRNVALAASIIFAVMPLSWLLRRVYLDSILLPFLLASVLLAVYIKRPKRSDTNLHTNAMDSSIKISILLSGILLGLAIYTKIPAFTMIPLVGYLVYKNSNSFKALGFWFIPVILIPAMWPAYSISVGQFDEWKDGVLHQTQRTSISIVDSISTVFLIDPVFVTLGIVGVIVSGIKRDLFCLLWIIPFVLLSVTIEYVQYFHVILLLPAFSIGIALLLETTLRAITEKRILQNSLMFSLLIAIGMFGLVSSSMLITANVNSSYFAISSFVVQHLVQPKNADSDASKMIAITDHWWTYNTLWIPVYVFDKDVEFEKSTVINSVMKDIMKDDRVIVIADQPFINIISQNPDISPNYQKKIIAIHNLLNLTRKIATFRDSVNPSNLSGYPYTSLNAMILNENRPLGRIEVRSNY